MNIIASLSVIWLGQQLSKMEIGENDSIWISNIHYVVISGWIVLKKISYIFSANLITQNHFM